MDAYRAANRTADELQKLTSNFDSHIELQLGRYLPSATSGASDLVGMWQGLGLRLRPHAASAGLDAIDIPMAAGTDHRHELTRSEFNCGVAKWVSVSASQCRHRQSASFLISSTLTVTLLGPEGGQSRNDALAFDGKEAHAVRAAKKRELLRLRMRSFEGSGSHRQQE